MTHPASAPQESRKSRRTSSEKVLNVLNLFTEEQPAWSVEMMMEKLGSTRATTYRYVKALDEAGLLAPGAGGSYVLGPRIIQLERQIQRSDPLLQLAVPLMASDQSPLIGAKIISSFYGNQVLAIHLEKLDPDIELTMGRGQVFPLLYGTPSKIILAYLSPYQMKTFYAANSEEVQKAGLGDTWKDFRTNLRLMRRKRYCSGSHSNPKVIGFSAPIFHDKSSVSASLSYICRIGVLSEEQKREVAARVVAAAEQISERLIKYRPENGQVEPVFTTPRVSS